MKEQSPYKTTQTRAIDPRWLRIGNLVEYNGITWYVHGICIPAPMEDKRYSDKYIIDLFDGAGVISVTIEDIEAILIDSDVLTKAGFEFSSHFVWQHTKSGILFDQCEPECEYRYNTGITSAYPYSDIVIRSLYLHDLQNKYFAIRGKELKIKL